jgi:hypothetical protein
MQPIQKHLGVLLLLLLVSACKQDNTVSTEQESAMTDGKRIFLTFTLENKSLCVARCRDLTRDLFPHRYPTAEDCADASGKPVGKQFSVEDFRKNFDAVTSYWTSGWSQGDIDLVKSATNPGNNQRVFVRANDETAFTVNWNERFNQIVEAQPTTCDAGLFLNDPKRMALLYSYTWQAFAGGRKLSCQLWDPADADAPQLQRTAYTPPEPLVPLQFFSSSVGGVINFGGLQVATGTDEPTPVDKATEKELLEDPKMPRNPVPVSGNKECVRFLGEEGTGYRCAGPAGDSYFFYDKYNIAVAPNPNAVVPWGRVFYKMSPQQTKPFAMFCH